MNAKEKALQNIDTRDLTLLFVEDDPNTIKGISFMLEASFKKVHIASNGQEGLDLFTKYQDTIDIVVTDIRMPKLNGTEMILEIRKIKAHIPVIVTTAFSERDYLMKSIELGVNSYMVKPFKVMELLDKIKNAYYPIIQEKELHDQYALTKNILDAQDNFTLLINDEGKIKMANQTMLNFFNIEKIEKFLEKHECICDLFINDEGYLSKNKNDKTWLEIILNNQDEIYKVKLKDTNNKIFIFYIRVKEITYQNKIHHVVIFNDITELEILTLRKFKQEKLIAEHAKMAQMGSMIGSIAHQWRQPLSIISSIASGVQLKSTIGTLPTSQLNEYMEKLLETTEYLSQTITTFRNFLKEKKEYKEVSIQERIQIALNIVNLTLKENAIELKKELHHEDPIIVKIVTGELEEVIINIINNAKDAICEKEKKNKDSWISLELFRKNGNAIVTIEDTAGGINPKVLPHIFDEYFTTKDETKGTGLGLYMSKQIVEESLRGKLSIENTQNGAKFTIELPLVQKDTIN